MSGPSVQGVFIPTSENFQVSDEELRIVLTKQTYQTAFALNLKETGIYQTVEIQTSQTWYSQNVQQPRYGFRKVFEFGSILAGATLTIAHGINFTMFTSIYGTCVTDVVDNRPIPYASTAANSNIEVNVDAVNINLSNGAAGPNIVTGIIVLEYLKN